MLRNIGKKVETFLDNTENKHGLFLKKLGSRAGLLLKEFAILVLVLGIILSIISGIVTFFEDPAWAKEAKARGAIPYSYNGELYSEVRAQYRTAGLITLVGGCAGSIFTFLLILGFGQLVEEHTLMRKLMERQMGLKEDPEPKVKTESQQEDQPAPKEPEIRHKASPEPPRASYDYTSSVTDDKQSEDLLRNQWRLKKYNNEESDNKKG